jgi:hypothetical protein
VYRDRSCLCVLSCETFKVKTSGDVSTQPHRINEIMEDSLPCGKTSRYCLIVLLTIVMNHAGARGLLLTRRFHARVELDTTSRSCHQLMSMTVDASHSTAMFLGYSEPSTQALGGSTVGGAGRLVVLGSCCTVVVGMQAQALLTCAIKSFFFPPLPLPLPFPPHAIFA